VYYGTAVDGDERVLDEVRRGTSVTGLLQVHMQMARTDRPHVQLAQLWELVCLHGNKTGLHQLRRPTTQTTE
jgi:hypothetical protein